MNEPLRRTRTTRQDIVKQTAPAFFAAYFLLGAILLLAAIGYLLDRWLDTGPWLLVAGLLIGVSIGFVGLVTSMRTRRRSRT